MTRPGSTALSKRRRWLFRLIAMIVVPALVLGALELGLWLCGFGYAPGFIVPVEGRSTYTTNLLYGRRFFPVSLARWPVPCELQSPKPQGAYRIFILGGSAAQGVPDEAFAFGRILTIMLETAYPQQRFEVINTGMTAINSHVVRDIAHDCARFEPDLFVVYMGNNEVVGPYGPGTVFAGFGEHLSAIRLSISVRRLRMAQVMVRASEMFAQNQSWRGMEMFVDHRVSADDPRLQQTYAYFRTNLIDICAAAEQGGADVVLCTMATNLKDCPPFASAHRAGLSVTQLANWQTAFDQGTTDEKEGHHAQAIAAYEQALAIDDGYAELCYRLGRCYQAMQDIKQAKKFFVQARDADALRFRTDSRINDIIREVSNQHGLLADVDHTLNEQPDIPGNQWLYEHVHLRFAGNYKIAQTVFARVRSLLGEPQAQLPDLEQCKAQLALTNWQLEQFESDIRLMTQRPPFTGQLDHEQDQLNRKQWVTAWREQLDQPGQRAHALQVTQDAIERRPEDMQLCRQFALMLAAAGQYDRALGQWQRLLERLPNRAPWQGELGKVLARMRRNNEAIAKLRAALRVMPYDTSLLANLGGALLEAQQLDDAEPVLRRALVYEPDHVVSHNNLALLLAARGRNDEALEHYEHALRLDPENAGLHYNIALLFSAMGNAEQAAVHLHEVLRLVPNHRGAIEALDRMSDQ